MQADHKPLSTLVRGSNDIASAVAHRLFRAGYAVVIHDLPQPAATRRKMAFTDAIFDGQVLFEGVQAVRVADLSLLEGLLVSHASIPVVTGEFTSLLATLQPAILIDARMRKHHQPESQLGLAPLTIGLGPNFTAGETVDLAVETRWGDSLGQVVRQGSTSPLQGEPRPLGGQARARYVYAPVTAIFHTDFQIGDAVQQGQIVAWLDTTPLPAPLTGRLRGLTHPGVPVSQGTKIIEVDPRGDSAEISGIAERPRRIAEGVLNAVQSWFEAASP
jgi:xanthine dehydrogenase accessory factor